MQPSKYEPPPFTHLMLLHASSEEWRDKPASTLIFYTLFRWLGWSSGVHCANSRRHINKSMAFSYCSSDWSKCSSQRRSLWFQDSANSGRTLGINALAKRHRCRQPLVELCARINHQICYREGSLQGKHHRRYFGQAPALTFPRDRNAHHRVQDHPLLRCPAHIQFGVYPVGCLQHWVGLQRLVFRECDLDEHVRPISFALKDVMLLHSGDSLENILGFKVTLELQSENTRATKRK